MRQPGTTNWPGAGAGGLEPDEAAELARLTAIRDGDYTPEQRQHAGVVLYVTYAGELRATHAMVLVASPAYLRERGTPRRLDQLATHDALVFRLPSSGKDRTWRLRSSARAEVDLLPDSRVRVNDGEGLVQAHRFGKDQVVGAHAAQAPWRNADAERTDRRMPRIYHLHAHVRDAVAGVEDRQLVAAGEGGLRTGRDGRHMAGGDRPSGPGQRRRSHGGLTSSSRRAGVRNAPSGSMASRTAATALSPSP